MHEAHGKYTPYTAAGLANTASVSISLWLVVKALVYPSWDCWLVYVTVVLCVATYEYSSLQFIQVCGTNQTQEQ